MKRLVLKLIEKARWIEMYFNNFTLMLTDMLLSLN